MTALLARRRSPLAARRRSALVALLVLAAGCGCRAGGAAPSTSIGGAGASSSTVAASPAGPALSSAATASATPSPARTSAPASAADRDDDGLTAADRLAGLRSRAVPWSAGGSLKTVPGQVAAPGPGRVYRIRVEVESGLDVDPAAFAQFVMSTLNDPRSWTENGRRTFARTSGAADIVVVLASPAKSAAMCAPLQTFGKLSCHEGDDAVLTMYRWVRGIPGYGKDLTGYRHYVVNHEVGHALGHHHEYCAGQGKLAPVMMQQTKGLLGCRPNPWPHPSA